MAFSFDQRERRIKSHRRTPEIPFDLVIEILRRLPAKSLVKFKSVSKIWSSLICSRDFTNSFIRVTSSPPRLYMSLNFFDKNIFLSSSPSFDSEGRTTISSFDADQDLTIPALRGYVSNDVFRGLMCFINGTKVQIYNTTTRQLVALPDIEESSIIGKLDDKIKKIMCHIGHDPVHDQYKVVCKAVKGSEEEDGEYMDVMSEHWVFLLGGDGSSRWKNISCGSPPQKIPLRQVVNMNGRMHYLALVGIYIVLVSFDIISEEISVRQVPEDIFWPDVGLIEYGGNIAVLYYPNLKKEGVIELWVMEDEEKNIWGSKTLVLHSSQMHMVINRSRLRVQGTTRNGEVIFVPRDTNLFNIFLYDLRKNHMRKIEIKGTPNRHLTQSCEVLGLDDVENLIFL